MYWNISVLTKTGKELRLIMEGRKDYILSNIEMDDLTVISIVPNFTMTFKRILNKGTLTSSKLSLFFIDFSRMLKSGLSVSETARTLSETTLDPQIKIGLERIRISINDGYSLKTAFENAKIFPKIVCISLDAAEKSEQIPEISKKLGEYFEYLNENKNKIVSSLIYPALVFIALTIASVVISMELVPQLGFLISEKEMNSFSMRLLDVYSNFMKSYWWLMIIILVTALIGLWYTWHLNRDKLMKYLFRVPILGNVLKEIEFANIFLNLFIYIKSGISATEALTNIHSIQDTFVTNKLIEIRNRINGGSTLGESFEKDEFFPPFIQQSLKKGEETGKRTEYLYETYKYYDSKSKESIKAVIKFINPALMSLAFVFAGFIASFYVLIYRNIGAMGAGIYQ